MLPFFVSAILKSAYVSQKDAVSLLKMDVLSDLKRNQISIFLLITPIIHSAETNNDYLPVHNNLVATRPIKFTYVHTIFRATRKKYLKE